MGISNHLLHKCGMAASPLLYMMATGVPILQKNAVSEAAAREMHAKQVVLNKEKIFSPAIGTGKAASHQIPGGQAYFTTNPGFALQSHPFSHIPILLCNHIKNIPHFFAYCKVIYTYESIVDFIYLSVPAGYKLLMSMPNHTGKMAASLLHLGKNYFAWLASVFFCAAILFSAIPLGAKGPYFSFCYQPAYTYNRHNP